MCQFAPLCPRFDANRLLQWLTEFQKHVAYQVEVYVAVDPNNKFQKFGHYVGKRTVVFFCTRPIIPLYRGHVFAKDHLLENSPLKAVCKYRA